MSITDEKIQNLRWKRKVESSFVEYDYSKRLFFIGWILFYLLGSLSYKAFGYGMLNVARHTLGRPEEMEQLLHASLALIAGVFGYFFGHLVSFIILRHLGKRWRGNLHFGKHPVFFISLASWISFNICFILLLSIIMSYRKNP